MSHAPDTAEAPPPAAPAAAPSPCPVSIDWPCAGCGYNLRTLDRTATCPECGLPVAVSLEASRFTAADRRRCGRVRLGAILLAVSVGMTLGSMLLYLSFYWREPSDVETLAWPFMLWVAAEHALWVLGAWQVTSPPTAGRWTMGGRKLPAAARISAAINSALMAAVIVPAAIVLAMRDGEEMLIVSLFATPAVFVARMVAGLCIGGWMVRLSRQLEQSAFATELGVALLIFGLTMTLLLIGIIGIFTGGEDALESLLFIVLVGFSAVTAWCTLWLIRFERRLRRMAQAPHDPPGGVLTPDP